MASLRPLDVATDWWWIKEKAHCVLCADTKGIVAVNEQGAILAAAVFDNWTKTNCCIHIAIESPIVIRSGFCHAICDYVFNQTGRIMLTGMTPANNPRALRFILHAGMKEILRVKDGFDIGVDYVITQMRKDECRWLDGQRRTGST